MNEYFYTASFPWSKVGFTDDWLGYYINYTCRDWDNNLTLDIGRASIRTNSERRTANISESAGGIFVASSEFYRTRDSGKYSIDADIYLNGTDSTVEIIISYSTRFVAFSSINSLMTSSNRTSME